MKSYFSTEQLNGKVLRNFNLITIEKYKDKIDNLYIRVRVQIMGGPKDQLVKTTYIIFQVTLAKHDEGSEWLWVTLACAEENRDDSCESDYEVS